MSASLASSCYAHARNDERRGPTTRASTHVEKEREPEVGHVDGEVGALFDLQRRRLAAAAERLVRDLRRCPSSSVSVRRVRRVRRAPTFSSTIAGESVRKIAESDDALILPRTPSSACGFSFACQQAHNDARAQAHDRKEL